MINIKYISKRLLPTLVAGITALSTYGCSTKPQKIDQKNIPNTSSLEQYEDMPYLYSIKSYDSEKSKGTPYEMKRIQKSYNTKCTPKNLKNT